MVQTENRRSVRKAYGRGNQTVFRAVEKLEMMYKQWRWMSRRIEKQDEREIEIF